MLKNQRFLQKHHNSQPQLRSHLHALPQYQMNNVNVTTI